MGFKSNCDIAVGKNNHSDKREMYLFVIIIFFYRFFFLWDIARVLFVSSLR